MTKINYELRGLIYSMYPNESTCAKKLGWTRQRLNRITTGNKIPDLEEVNDLAECLGTTIEKMAQFFLTNKSPNEQQSKK